MLEVKAFEWSEDEETFVMNICDFLNFWQESSDLWSWHGF